MNNSILDPFKKSDWFNPSDLSAKQAKAIFEGKPKPKLSTEYWDTTYLDALSSNSEPIHTFGMPDMAKNRRIYDNFQLKTMGAIKRKEPEPEQTQESPSKEIINALVFVVFIAISIIAIYNAYLSHKNPDQSTSFQTVCFYSVIFAFGMLCGQLLLWSVGLINGDYDDWLKQNIDPYLLKIKSWLNRRNEQ